MTKILVFDHLAERRRILVSFLQGNDHVIFACDREEEALPLVREFQPDLVIAAGTLAGSKLLAEARALDSSVATLVLLGAPPTAAQVEGLLAQGSEYLVELNLNEFQAKIERLLNRRAGPAATRLHFRDLVGSSPRMQTAFWKLTRAAGGERPVLLLGEKGTGKQAFAREIHRLSRRKDGPFRVQQCEGLSEPEPLTALWGHEPGAWPRAVAGPVGELELADQGTLYLGNAEALGALAQIRLLRLLEERIVQRVGSNQTRAVDVRLIAGCEPTLLSRVQEGRFRSDLYYQLGGHVIELPPLRARVLDIPELAEFFAHPYGVEFAPEAMEMLMNHSWPGNVDELKSVVEQAVNLCEENQIELRHLPPRILRSVARGGRRYKFTPANRSQ